MTDSTPTGAAAPGGRQRSAVVFILGSISAVQLSAVLATHIFQQVGPAGGALLGVGFGAIILAVVVRPSWRALVGPSRLPLIGYGLVLSGMNLTFYLGISRVPLGTAVSIEFLGPLTVAAVYAGRPRNRWWVLLATAGVLGLTRPWSEHRADPVGVAWLLVDSVCWGSYILLGARAARGLPGLQPIALAMAISGLFLVVPGILDGGPALLKADVVLVGLGVALVGQVVPYSLELLALRRITAGAFGILMALEPAVASVTGFVFLRQPLGLLGTLSILAVVAAGIAVTRDQRDGPNDVETLAC
ncbi:EamA family transporter [Streptomyces sp. NPDC056159]|uniref:EamA family transporter n=1 Tax=Streptomyces sp. NPDC056159 TaxID=3155537 RepID=UPI0034348A31